MSTENTNTAETNSTVSGQEQAETPAATENPVGAQEDENAPATETGNDADAAQDETDSSTETQTDVEINLPEGSIIEDKAEFLGVLKDATTSQEGFDKLLETVNDMAKKAAEDKEQAEAQAWENTKSQWEQELKRDENFGKDYQGNVDLALATAKEVDADFGKWLEETGFDKNPHVLRAMAKVGKQRSDAEVHMGGKIPASAPKNPDGTHKPQFNLDYLNQENS